MELILDCVIVLGCLTVNLGLIYIGLGGRIT